MISSSIYYSSLVSVNVILRNTLWKWSWFIFSYSFLISQLVMILRSVIHWWRHLVRSSQRRRSKILLRILYWKSWTWVHSVLTTIKLILKMKIWALWLLSVKFYKKRRNHFHSLTASSISVILVSEIGDKTFFIAAILAMTNNKVFVFISALAALYLMTVLSALLGWVVTTFIPREVEDDINVFT